MKTLCSVNHPKTAVHLYEVSKMSKTTEMGRVVAADEWGVGNGGFLFGGWK